jgi:hypothetical protein
MILPCPLRYRHDSGWELRQFSSVYKKSAKRRVHHLHPPPPTVFLLFADFFTELTGPKYNIILYKHYYNITYHPYRKLWTRFD